MARTRSIAGWQERRGEGCGGLAPDQRIAERQVVVLRLPQCHRHGRRRRPRPPLRHVRARMVTLTSAILPFFRGDRHGILMIQLSTLTVFRSPEYNSIQFFSNQAIDFVCSVVNGSGSN